MGARTALNSGNAVFLAKPGPKDDLREKIRAALEVHAGWAQAVAALRLSELGRAMEECLLAAQGGDASKLLALFPLAAGDLSGAVALAGQDWGQARMLAGSIAAYAACPEGVSRSVLFKKLAASMGGGQDDVQEFCRACEDFGARQ